jgi:alpha-tubulin suppressor-like RCC1 family protein
VFCFVSSSIIPKIFLDLNPLFSNNLEYNENTIFIINIIKNFNIKNIDFLTCNTLSFPNWVTFYNILMMETDVIVTASNNNNGTIINCNNYEEISIELIYFNNIKYYKYLLDFNHNNIFIINNQNKVFTCGSNQYNQFGNDLPNQYYLIEVFKQFNESKTIKNIKTSNNNVFCLMTDGTVYESGYNKYGNKNNKDILKIDDIFIGLNHSIIDANKHIYACGINNFGQFGNGTNISSYNTSVHAFTSDILLNKKIIKICLGHNYSMVLVTYLKKKYIYACGDNTWGQFGNGNLDSSNILIEACLTLPNCKIKNIYTNEVTTFILDTDGNVYICGINYILKSIIPNLIKLIIPDNNKVLDIVTDINSSQSSNALFLMEDGSIYAWGTNYYGQFGNGTNKPSKPYELIPAFTILNKKIKQINLTGLNSYCLMNDNTVYACGDNTFGQLGIGNDKKYSYNLVQMCISPNCPITNIKTFTGNFIEFPTTINYKRIINNKIIVSKKIKL